MHMDYLFANLSSSARDRLIKEILCTRIIGGREELVVNLGSNFAAVGLEHPAEIVKNIPLASILSADNEHGWFYRARLSSIIDELDKLIEEHLLTMQEIDISSTRGRAKMKLIYSLHQVEGTIEGHEQIKSYWGTFTLDETSTNDITQTTGFELNSIVDHVLMTRQGDPLSPILFNIVADMLAVLIERAKEDGQIGGVERKLLSIDGRLQHGTLYDIILPIAKRGTKLLTDNGWLGHNTLREQYPALLNMSMYKAL
ncbi:hypothetical protein ACJX0J_011552, partial [Zea mays]